MRKRFLLLGLMGLLLLWLASCGTKNVGTLDVDQLESNRQSTGVTAGGFEVIRYNTAGFADPGLNPTLGLRLEPAANGQALVISVEDATYTTTVALDILYDPGKAHPETVEFHGLLGAGDEVLSASFLGSPGRAGVGETRVGEYQPPALDGEFATIVFTDGAGRDASAAGDPHSNTNGVGLTNYQSVPNLFVRSSVDDSEAHIVWTGAWHAADGDQNSEVNIADITPIGSNYGAVPDTTNGAIIADYDENTEVNISDLTPIGVFFGEKTTEYRVTVEDDDNETEDAGTSITLGWTDGVNPAETWPPLDPWPPTPDFAAFPAATVTTPLYDYEAFWYWLVPFTAASDITYAQLTTADADENGTARVFITPVADGTDGVTSYVDLEVGEPEPPKDVLVITSYMIMVDNATGGCGPDGEHFDDTHAAGVVTANDDVALTLANIAGTFGSENFDGETTYPTPGGMTQEDYDYALGLAQNNLVWDIDHGGHADFRRTTDWLMVPDPEAAGSFMSWPISGVPDPPAEPVWDGYIFPDYDPESTGTLAEGTMTSTLQSDTLGNYPDTDDLDIQVPASYEYSYTFDVEVDPLQPLITLYGLSSTGGFEVEELIIGENNLVPIEFDWNVDPIPTDLSTTALEMFRIAGNVPAGAATVFEYSTEAPSAGQYTLVEDPESQELMVQCVVAGALIQPGAEYLFRFNNATAWSTINLPEDMLPTAEAPPSQELTVIPQICAENIDYIQLFYDDPVVRRNGRVEVDLITGSVDPLDSAGYNDVLKINGDEFIITVDVGQALVFPQIVVQETEDPEDITGLDDPDKINGVFLVERQKNRLVADIATVTPPNPPAETLYYALKCYDQTEGEVGWGTFNVAPIPIDPPNPSGVNWGVNVFDREEREINQRTYDFWQVNGSTVGGTSPDVMWVEFADGWVYDYQQDEEGFNPSNTNVRIKVTDNDSGREEFMEMGLRIVGLGATGNFIAIHTVTPNDFVFPGSPGWPGVLSPGVTYTVELDDPHEPGIEHTFTDFLVVTGTNPNIT